MHEQITNSINEDIGREEIINNTVISIPEGVLQTDFIPDLEFLRSLTLVQGAQRIHERSLLPGINLFDLQVINSSVVDRRENVPRSMDLLVSVFRFFEDVRRTSPGNQEDNTNSNRDGDSVQPSSRLSRNTPLLGRNMTNVENQSSVRETNAVTDGKMIMMVFSLTGQVMLYLRVRNFLL